MTSIYWCEGISATQPSGPWATYRKYTEDIAKSFGHQALHFSSQLGKLSPHRRHPLTSLSRAEVKGDWKWITSLVWSPIMAFPWHQVLSYPGSALLIFYSLWLMLANSPTRKAIKWFPGRKGAAEVSKWARKMPKEIIWDVPAPNL